MTASLPVATNAFGKKSEANFPSLWFSSLIWGIAALFYLSGFYQRVSPAVMTDALMGSFHISARELS